MNLSPIFNFIQCVYTLNMFSNLASDKKAPAPVLQKDLDTMLKALFSNPDMQKFIGTWEIQWGPVVQSYGEDVKKQAASNALFVAKNQDGQYVVATSGTNPISLYGWFVEDFDVRTMQLWPGQQDTPDAPRISNGTFTGLNALLAMQSNGITLQEFLMHTFGTSNERVQLVVSGHSLGGALSSTLALYLDQQIEQWNPAKTVIVSAVPTAGASPGNKAFSAFFNKTIGSRTLRFWNKFDPVPHGWQLDMIEEVPFLYYPYFKPGVMLQAITATVLAQSLEGTKLYPDGGFYTQLELQTPPLPGQVNITATRNPSGAEVLQLFIDMDAKDILKKLGANAIVTTLVVDALNIILNDFAGEETLDQLMDEIRARLAKILGKESYLEKLLLLLERFLNQLENVMIFLIQLAYQHVTAYADLMGVAQMHPLSQSIISKLVEKGEIGGEYKGLIARLNDPKQAIKLVAPRLGNVVSEVLTAEFTKNNGLDVMQ